jgi:alkylation response protein AidB-like acyl-CoA dehydrogenase
MPAPGSAYIPSAFEQLISERAKTIIKTLHDFIYDEVMPTEKLFEAQMPADRWSSIPPVVEELKKKAKSLGLWNLFLHKGYKEGPGLTNLEYAIMAELTGLTRLAPEVDRSRTLVLISRLQIVQRRIQEIWRCLQSMEVRSRSKNGWFRC